MADIKEHRLYKHMSEPMRVFGLTVDEAIIGVGGFFSSLALQNHLFLSLGLMFGSITSVLLIKKIKKKLKSTHMKSFLFWSGLWPRPSKTFPKFHNREYRR